MPEANNTPSEGGTPGAGGGEAPISFKSKDEAKSHFQSNFRDYVHPDYAGDKITADYKSLDDVFKGHINASKLIGQDKVAKYNPKWTPEEKRQWYQSQGKLPADSKGYTMGRPEKAAPEFIIDQEEADYFRQKFYESNTPTEQAEALWNAHVARKYDLWQREQAKKATNLATSEANLRAKYGDTLSMELKHANSLVEKYDASKRVLGKLRDAGLSADEDIINLMIAIGNDYKSDSMPRQKSASAGMSPSQAKAIADKWLSDPQHPVNNRNHGEHNTYYKQYMKLREIEFNGRQ